MNRANRRVLNNFEKAVRAHAVKGGEVPAMSELVEAIYEVNKGALEALIEYLERPRRSAREKELQKALDSIWLVVGPGSFVTPERLDEVTNIVRPCVVIKPTQ